MVVFNLNAFGSVSTPSKHQPPLLINPYGILSLSLSLQPFQSISRGNSQVLQSSCLIQLNQFTQGHPFDGPPSPTIFRSKEFFRFAVGKGINHPIRRATARSSLALAAASGVVRHSSGQSRVYPSPFNFLVASIPTWLPQCGKVVAWSRLSLGP